MNVKQLLTPEEHAKLTSFSFFFESTLQDLLSFKEHYSSLDFPLDLSITFPSTSIDWNLIRKLDHMPKKIIITPVIYEYMRKVYRSLADLQSYLSEIGQDILLINLLDYQTSDNLVSYVLKELQDCIKSS